MRVERAQRLRFWLLYAAAWTPFAVLYAVLIGQQGAPPAGAVFGSLTTVVPAALLGAAVWRIAGRVGRARRADRAPRARIRNAGC